MEIERKFLISKENLPADLDSYPHHRLEQGYLSTAPVVRIRKEDDNYYLTYKSKGLMTREEYNLPLTKESYEHMRPKADGILISKTRYLIPEKNGLTIELDVFDTPYEGLFLAEVEFSSEEQALKYTPPAWFGEDVTNSGKYHNSRLSQGNLRHISILLVSSMFSSSYNKPESEVHRPRSTPLGWQYIQMYIR